MEKSISSDLIRGHIDTIILHTLISGDKFAQQISDEIESKSENKYQINQATLYSSLKRLETQKYILGYWHDTENGRRRNFKITDAGKKFVEDNLNNWSYSRAIIDRLIDFTPEPVVYQTKIVEKIVEVPVEVPVYKTVENSQPFAKNNEIALNSAKTEEQPFQKSEQKVETENTTSTQEINFRNILNGLIRTQSVKKETENEVLEPIGQNDDKNENTADETQIPSFNDSISSSDYSNIHNVRSQIDFGDLSIQAREEGFKLRISSKDTKVTGSLLENKINFFSALAVLLVTLIEFMVISFTAKDILKIDTLKTVITILVLLIFPITMSIIYFKNPKKTCKSIKGDSIIIALVVIFNLLLFTFVFDLLLNLDFSDTFSLIVGFIIPIVLYLDALIFFVIRYFISLRKEFKIKQK